MRWLGLLAGCVLSVATPTGVHAEARFLVVMGADAGVPGDVPLRYAASDARRVATTFQELGSLSRAHVLTSGGASELQRVLERVKDEVALARQGGERALLLFYYSGHADRDFLHAYGSRLSWAKLRSLLHDVGADTTVSFIDACASGGVAVAKGARSGEPFAVERETTMAKGTVWLTSSRGDEASFESDELGGSFFTHYIVSAMRGAGDVDENGRVTLNEMYQFAYQQTVGETSLRLRSVQHPTYGFELAGEGEIVLTEPTVSRTSLVLPRELHGVYFLSRRYGTHRNTIEIAKKQGALVRMGLGPGEYLLYRRDHDRLWLASYVLRDGGEVVVGEADLRARRYDNVVGKGGAIVLDGWQSYAGGGMTAPLVRGAPFAPVVQTGVLWYRGGTGIDLAAAYTQFGLTAIDTRVHSRALDLTALVVALAESSAFVASIGAGVSGLWLLQSPDQVASLTPAVAARARLDRRLAGPVGLWVEVFCPLRFMHVDGEQQVTVRASPRVMTGLSLAVQ